MSHSSIGTAFALLVLRPRAADEAASRMKRSSRLVKSSAANVGSGLARQIFRIRAYAPGHEGRCSC